MLQVAADIARRPSAATTGRGPPHSCGPTFPSCSEGSAPCLPLTAERKRRATGYLQAQTPSRYLYRYLYRYLVATQRPAKGGTQPVLRDQGPLSRLGHQHTSQRASQPANLDPGLEGAGIACLCLLLPP